MMVSRELAEKRGTYSMLKPLDAMQIHLDVDRLMNDLTLITDEIERFRQYCSNLPSREVTYEALVADKAGTVREILTFLDAKSHEPAGSKLKKTNPAPLADVIANYDQVASALEKDPRFRRFVA